MYKVYDSAATRVNGIPRNVERGNPPIYENSSLQRESRNIKYLKSIKAFRYPRRLFSG
jgi:hypothetical protein